MFFGGAEKDAARAQERGLADQTAELRRQFNVNRRDFAPFVERGNQAGNRLADLLGINGPEAEAAALAEFNESPGQRFLRERQERSLLRNSAAIGGLGGGNVRTALQKQAANIANLQLGERKNRLAAVAGGGQTAVTNQAGLGSQLSSQIGRSLAGVGDARASGILGANNARRDTLERVGRIFI